MIVPNLLANNMAESVAFYQTILGMSVNMSVGPGKAVNMGEAPAGAVFTVMKWGELELMLQSPESLAEDLPGFAPTDPSGVGTIYFRGLDPDEVAARVGAAAIIKGPELAWYGMRELYIRDPSGHVICVGRPNGDAPE